MDLIYLAPGAGLKYLIWFSNLPLEFVGILPKTKTIENRLHFRNLIVYINT